MIEVTFGIAWQDLILQLSRFTLLSDLPLLKNRGSTGFGLIHQGTLHHLTNPPGGIGSKAISHVWAIFINSPRQANIGLYH